MLYSSSQACHWLEMNYSLFFLFLSQKKEIDHRIRDRPACMTVSLCDSTLSEPASPPPKTALLFFSLCPLQCTPITFFQRIFHFTIPLPSHLSPIENFIRATFDGSLNCLRAGTASSACQTNMFKRTCE